MKKLWKKCICGLMAFISVLSCVGCGKKDDALVIWTFTDELSTMVNDYYKKNVDSKLNVEIKTIEVNDMVSKLDSALRAQKNLPDIVAVEEKFIRKYATGGKLENLDDLLTDATEMYDYTLNAAKNTDGNVVAYAWQATPGALYYRTDMAREILGVNTPEEMQAKVDTWAKFLETAEILYNANTDNFKNIKILSDVTAPARSFYSSRSTGWIVDNTLTIDPSLYEGEESLYEIIKALQIGAGTWGTEQPYVNETTERTTAWFADMSGNDVFSFLLPSYSLHYDLKKNCENKTAGTTTAGKWAICQGPQVFSDGGTWLGIIKGTNKSEKARELIKYFTMNTDFLRAWANDTGDFMNNKTLMREFAQDTTRAESFLGGQNHYAVFDGIAAQISGNNLTAYDSKINAMFSEWAINYAKLQSLGTSDQTKAKASAMAGFIDGVAGAYPRVNAAITNPCE